MSADRAFVDSNVVIYAHDVTAGDKHAKARDLMADLWRSRSGCVSVQVLQEFFVTATRKVKAPLDPASAALVIDDLALWHVHCPTADDVLAAIDVQAKAAISFWDAMIVRSAVQLGCDVLYTEDLDSGQDYCGVRARNPFS